MTTAYMLLVVTVYALAVARLTRLINGDRILDRFRLIPARKIRQAQAEYQDATYTSPPRPALAAKAQRAVARWDGVNYFVQCPWCVGMWVAAFTAWVPLFFHDNPVARYVAVVLAVSHFVGLFARFADTEEIEIEDGPANG